MRRLALLALGLWGCAGAVGRDDVRHHDYLVADGDATPLTTGASLAFDGANGFALSRRVPRPEVGAGCVDTEYYDGVWDVPDPTTLYLGYMRAAYTTAGCADPRLNYGGVLVPLPVPRTAYYALDVAPGATADRNTLTLTRDGAVAVLR